MTFLTVSAQLGILATAVALLMIGGEFDLSLGSMIGFAGMVIGLGVTEFDLPIGAAILAAFAVALARRPRQRPARGPDAAAVLHRHARKPLHPARPDAGGDPRRDRPHADPLHPRRRPGPWTAALFGGHVSTGFFHWLGSLGWIASRRDGIPVVQGLPMSIVWWIVLTVGASWVLTQTRFGNWIFAAGGDPTRRATSASRSRG